MEPKFQGLASAFSAASPPPALQPTAKDRLFQVALLWQGTQLVDVARLDAGRPGLRPMPLAQELLPAALTPRAQLLPGGDVALLFPTDVKLQIARGETSVTPADLFAAREAEPIEVPFRGLRYVLKMEDRVVLSTGQLQLVGRYLRPERAAHRPLRDRLDPMMLSMITIGAIFSAFVLGVFRLALSTSPEFEEGSLMKQRPIVVAHPAPLPPPPPIHVPTQLAGGDPGTAGQRDRPPQTGGLHHGQRQDRPRSLGRTADDFFRALDQTAGTHAVLGSGGNTELDVYLRGLTPGSVATASGNEGWAPHGTGPGGGGPLDVPRIGSPTGPRDGTGVGFRFAPKEKTDIDPHRIIVDGDLIPKDAIARIIRNHWSEIRYCYEKELSKDPNLAGKVGMRFQIGPIGDVTEAKVSESTLGNSPAEQCMIGNVLRWKFPAPKGGGLVDVNYPFVFQTAR